MGKPSKRDEILLVPQLKLQAFDKWVIEFVGSISPVGKCTRPRYIITVMDYPARCVEATLVKDFIVVTIRGILGSKMGLLRKIIK